MKRLFSQIILTAIFCSAVGSVTAADTLIYNNASYGGLYNSGGVDTYDFGISTGGLVSKFTFGYSSTSVVPYVYVKFYQNINTYYNDPGHLIKLITLNNLPSTGGGVQYYTYVLPEADRFTLPANSQFGYSIILGTTTSNLAIASGGTGNANELWEYVNGDFGWDWYKFWFGSTSWAGLYMKIYTGPPLSTVTCNIEGYKFNDANGNGAWDAGEAALSGWDIYLDTNSNNVYDAGVDPNAVTDPNGLYRFRYMASPATYMIREIQKAGWTQTLPGSASGYEYSIVTDPNHTYGPYNFGNTEQVVPTSVKLYGYIETVGGIPIADAKVETGIGSSSYGVDYTDTEGYYEIVVSAPFSGGLAVTKDGWSQNTWSKWHTTLITDYPQDFEMLYLYGGGDGSQANPFKIYTLEQLEFITQQAEYHFDKCFVLMNDIDLDGETYTLAIIAPHDYMPFSGVFDGSGFSVLNLHSSSPLFGYIRNAVIKNLGVEDVEINGGSVGALCLSCQGGTIEHCFATGNVRGLFDAAGLCAWAHKSYLNGIIPGPSAPAINTPTIRNCYSTVNVTLDTPYNLFQDTFQVAGGLCGYAENAELTNNYACGQVDASGIVNVMGTECIIDCGGLIGHAKDCTITYNYSSGTIVEEPYNSPGGFCGKVSGSQTGAANYWDTETSGQSTSAYGTGLTTAQMHQMSFYTGWDFDTVWRICDGTNYPRLKWEPKPVGDFICPEGVELADLMILTEEWLGEVFLPSADIAPEGGDGIVSLQDWARFSAGWMSTAGQPNWDAACNLSMSPVEVIDEYDLAVFADQWLARTARYADIAPEGEPDGIVNLLDYAVLAENWLAGTD